MSFYGHVQVWAPDALGFDADDIYGSAELTPKDGAYVDWGMLGILRDMWLEGIRTVFSCEGEYDHPVDGVLPAYVMYENSKTAPKTIDKILKNHDKIKVENHHDAHKYGFWEKGKVKLVYFV